MDEAKQRLSISRVSGGGMNLIGYTVVIGKAAGKLLHRRFVKPERNATLSSNRAQYSDIKELRFERNDLIVKLS